MEKLKSVSKWLLAAVIRRLAKGDECKTCRGGYYPNYGKAPHVHVSRKIVVKGKEVEGFGSMVLDKAQWPDNFVEDPEIQGLGTYYCPNPKCSNSLGKTLERQKS